jgi:molybdenum cofactor biosynthesis protein MoaC
MKDISNKNPTYKVAKAEGKLVLDKETVDLVRNNKIKAGNVIETAKNCGIIAAKKASDIVIHSHNTLIDFVKVTVDLSETELTISCLVKGVTKSGIESNALAGVTNALLNAADMLRCICKTTVIQDIRIVESKGKGKDFTRKRVTPVKAAVLTVSNPLYDGKKKDNTTTQIVDFLKKHQVKTEYSVVLKEDEYILKSEIDNLINADFELIVVAGSVSLNSKGITPKVTKEIIDEELPGLSEAIRNFGKERTPYAMFSKEVCGVKNKTLVLNISGNSQGSIESLSALFPGLLKAFSMMKKR